MEILNDLKNESLKLQEDNFIYKNLSQMYKGIISMNLSNADGGDLKNNLSQELEKYKSLVDERKDKIKYLKKKIKHIKLNKDDEEF